MIDTKIVPDFKNPKKAFDEISLARCSVMATESLNPQEYDAFMFIHNVLTKRRGLQNKEIV